jgi:hypothetical protein
MIETGVYFWFHGWSQIVGVHESIAPRLGVAPAGFRTPGGFAKRSAWAIRCAADVARPRF